MLKKYKPNGEIEFGTVCFNSTTKQWQKINIVLKILFEKFLTAMITGLMKDLDR